MSEYFWLCIGRRGDFRLVPARYSVKVALRHAYVTIVNTSYVTVVAAMVLFMYG